MYGIQGKDRLRGVLRNHYGVKGKENEAMEQFTNKEIHMTSQYTRKEKHARVGLVKLHSAELP